MGMEGSDVQRFSATFQTLIAESGAPEDVFVELLGSQEAYQDLLSGARVPTLYEATLLGAFLKIDPSALMQKKEPSMGVSLRLGTVDGIHDVTGTVEHATRLLAVDRLTREWGFEEPVTELPSFAPSKNWHDRQAGKITATRLRAYLNIDYLEPVVDLTGLVERLGYPVEYRALPPDVHGISIPELWGDRAAWVIIINCHDGWARQRFTLAHELSHVLQNDAGQVIVDRATLADHRPERIADSFARHFLLPEEALESAIHSHGKVKSREQMAHLVADIMLSYGISRDATLIALRDFVKPALDADLLDFCAKAPVADIMRISAKSQAWAEANETLGCSFPSERLTKQALDAYSDGVVSLGSVADVIAGGDKELAAEQLRDAGWEDLVMS